MNQDKFEQQVVEYLNGTLSDPELREFEAHLSANPRLKKLVGQHKTVERWLSEWMVPEQSADKLEQLARRAKEQADCDQAPAAKMISFAGKRKHASLKRLPRLTLISAAAVLVAALVFQIRGSKPAKDPASAEVAQPGPQHTSPAAAARETAAIPEFLLEPEYAEHFDVIRDLDSLEELGDVLDDPQETMYSLATLKVIAGA